MTYDEIVTQNILAEASYGFPRIAYDEKGRIQTILAEIIYGYSKNYDETGKRQTLISEIETASQMVCYDGGKIQTISSKTTIFIGFTEFVFTTIYVSTGSHDEYIVATVFLGEVNNGVNLDGIPSSTNIGQLNLFGSDNSITEQTGMITLQTELLRGCSITIEAVKDFYFKGETNIDVSERGLFVIRTVPLNLIASKNVSLSQKGKIPQITLSGVYSSNEIKMGGSK